MADEEGVLSLFPEIAEKMKSNVKEDTAPDLSQDDYAGPMDLVRRDMANINVPNFSPVPPGRYKMQLRQDTYPSLPENTYLNGILQKGNKPISAYADEALSGVDDSYVSVGEQRGFVAKSSAARDNFEENSLDYMQTHERYWDHLTPGFFPWGPVYSTDLPSPKSLAPNGEQE